MSYECMWCGDVFDTKQEIIEHFNEYHASVIIEEVWNKYCDEFVDE
jgi:hypothetical protein